MMSSLCATLGNTTETFRGVICSDINLSANNYVTTSLSLNDDVYFFIVDQNYQTIWHQQRQFVDNLYSVTQFEFSGEWPPTEEI